MKRLLLLPLLLGFEFLIPNNAQAFFWGLTQEEESICRRRASKKQNSFSAKKAYDFCKKNIKKEISKEKKYKYCMSNFQDEINQAKYDFKLKKRKLYKEAKNNPPKNCDEVTPDLYHDAKRMCEALNTINSVERKIRLEDYDLGQILSGFDSKCRKKAGYK